MSGLHYLTTRDDARIAYRLDDYTRAGLATATRAHAEIFARLGASEPHHSPQAQGAGHIIGTARMGSDPATSVVDRDLQQDYALNEALNALKALALRGQRTNKG